MLLSKVVSKNKVTIRLTSERWQHITTSHLEIDSEDYKSIMDVINDPDIIFKGDQDEFLAVSDLVQLAEYGDDKLFIDYDKEADVLYVSFGRPQKADDAIQGEDGIIRRKKGKKIVGLTILNASRFRK